jgi:flagellin
MPPLVVNTNVTSLIAQQRLSMNYKTLNQSMERLSSGFRINHTSDDASGASISANLTSQLRRMTQASRNIQDGVSLLQTAEGSMETIGNNLQRVRELTVQAANDTNDSVSRDSISNEIRSLLTDNDRIANSTQLNGLNLLDGSVTYAPLQIGPNSTANTNTLDVSPVLTAATSLGLGLVGGGGNTFANIAAIHLTDNTSAQSFLSDVDAALSTANVQRASIGSFQNKLDSAGSNMDSSIVNFSATNSRIRDVDIASESATMTQYNILTQSATMVLSQTNDLPRMMLSLMQKN